MYNRPQNTQSAPSVDHAAVAPRQLLLVLTGDILLAAIDLQCVQQVIPLTAVQPLPKAPGHLLGLLDLHGTGVPVMDTSVANHLLQTVKAASLLGASCMLVGISPEMAQTIVGLGLDLSSISTYSNLRAGIQAALQSIGFAITPLTDNEESL